MILSSKANITIAITGSFGMRAVMVSQTIKTTKPTGKILHKLNNKLRKRI